MWFRKVLSALALVSLAGTLACQPAPQREEQAPPPPDPAPINALRDAVAAAYNANDAGAVANLYTQDAIWMPGHQSSLEGRAAIQAYLQTFFEANTVKTTISPQETQITGDWAYDRGTYTMALTPKAGGDATEQTGRYLVILRQEADGGWKVHRDIDNVESPMPGQ